mgnify:CR=1 FL=1
MADTHTTQALTAETLDAALVALGDQRRSITWLPTHVLHRPGCPGVIVREVPGGFEDAGGGFVAVVVS